MGLSKKTRLILGELQAEGSEMTATEIARKFGVSSQYVSKLAIKHLGQKPYERSKEITRLKAARMKDELRKLWLQGKSLSEIADEFGVGRNTVWRLVPKLDERLRRTRLIRKHKQIIESYLTLRREGASYEKIGEKYGVKGARVHKLIGLVGDPLGRKRQYIPRERRAPKEVVF